MTTWPPGLLGQAVGEQIHLPAILDCGMLYLSECWIAWLVWLLFQTDNQGSPSAGRSNSGPADVERSERRGAHLALRHAGASPAARYFAVGDQAALSTDQLRIGCQQPDSERASSLARRRPSRSAVRWSCTASLIGADALMFALLHKPDIFSLRVGDLLSIQCLPANARLIGGLSPRGSESGNGASTVTSAFRRPLISLAP